MSTKNTRRTIKNMVCKRCITAVQATLESLGISYSSVSLGEVIFEALPGASTMAQLEQRLNEQGFEILSTTQSSLVQKVKAVCLQALESDLEGKRPSISTMVGSTVNKEYGYLSRLFSSVEGITIEQYFLNLRVEKVKEMISYNELSLKEIAYQLGYSSVAHLSAQFKKVTGLTLSEFRENQERYPRKALDKL